MKKFLPLFALAALFVAACDTPTEVPMDDLDLMVAMQDNTLTGEALGTAGGATPSTNAINEGNGWAHVLWEDVLDVPIGQVTLNFVQPRAFAACFEYRIDDEAPTSPANGGANFNPAITDGLWNFTCQNNSDLVKLFNAQSHVDIRMVFGAEKDERFDWTRFYVLSEMNKDECKKGEWEALGFKNQGQCVRFVETGKDSRVGG